MRKQKGGDTTDWSLKGKETDSMTLRSIPDPETGALDRTAICTRTMYVGPQKGGAKRSKTGQKPSILSCFTRFMFGSSRTLCGFLHPWNRTFFELRMRPFRL